MSFLASRTLATSTGHDSEIVLEELALTGTGPAFPALTISYPAPAILGEHAPRFRRLAIGHQVHVSREQVPQLEVLARQAKQSSNQVLLLGGFDVVMERLSSHQGLVLITNRPHGRHVQEEWSTVAFVPAIDILAFKEQHDAAGVFLLRFAVNRLPAIDSPLWVRGPAIYRGLFRK